MNSQVPEKALLQLIDRRLREGASIQIDGMGSFEHDSNHRVIFRPLAEPLAFLAYAHEDRAKVKKLFRDLQRAGMNPWMDCQTLLPGQNWSRAVNQTIEVADFFIGCFSTHSVSKRGPFQSELGFALDVATRIPPDELFLIPIRLDDCEMPRQIVNTTHYVDLFPNWNRGLRKLVAALRRKRHGP